MLAQTTTTVETARWFRTYAARPQARVRLVCFPHAGGSAAAFRELSGRLPASVELTAVQYPGRQDRYGEPPAPDMDTLATTIAAAVEPLLDRPVAFFGHSLGATVAFETARRLSSRHRPALRHLFASARRAPAVPNQGPDIGRDDASVLAYVRGLGGTGAALLEDEDLREMALPVLRADFRLVDTYRYSPGAPLLCPITAVVGAEDDACRPDHARRWAECTAAGFDLRVLPGGHFYPETHPAELTELLTGTLGVPAA
ncbi:thioesterase II family protein [Kitasatospora brasiliensis]|uniref:thioesterase II family protein n=1 Tax=Kitasatospora brasiliensis TaxID=3058040 RepID=UPI00293002A7|nr:alpha/beta fold hydrolase [Kitasatospora sp. K002]